MCIGARNKQAIMQESIKHLSSQRAPHKLLKGRLCTVCFVIGAGLPLGYCLQTGLITFGLPCRQSFNFPIILKVTILYNQGAMTIYHLNQNIFEGKKRCFLKLIQNNRHKLDTAGKPGYEFTLLIIRHSNILSKLTCSSSWKDFCSPENTSM